MDAGAVGWRRHRESQLWHNVEGADEDKQEKKFSKISKM
jgi:hypothetical protein